MKKQLTIITFLFFGMSLQAQDFIYSQFLLSPLNLNPAMTGSFGGDQLMINYRDLEVNTFGDNFYQTMSFSYDRPFKLKNGDVIGAGIKYSRNSVSATNKIAQFSSALISYQKEILNKNNKRHFLQFGIEAGNSKQDWDYYFPFVRYNNLSEPIPDSVRLFADVALYDFSTGVNYKVIASDGRTINLGASVFHVSNPKFLNNRVNERQLLRRFTYYATGEFKINKGYWISPQIYLTKAGESTAVITSLGFILLKNKHKLEARLGGRFGGFEKGALFFSPTYFYNKKVGVSASFHSVYVEKYNGPGIDSYEGTLIYRFCRKKADQIID